MPKLKCWIGKKTELEVIGDKTYSGHVQCHGYPFGNRPRKNFRYYFVADDEITISLFRRCVTSNQHHNKLFYKTPKNPPNTQGQSTSRWY